MQTLDIISVNLWQILISLANLLLIFLIMKKVLYKPVKKVLDERKAAIDESYDAADKAAREAEQSRSEWEKKLEAAHDEADGIIKTATENASFRGGEIIAEARQRAEGIIRSAESEAELVRKRADESIKNEIVDVSARLTEKLLEREINEDDHRALIDSFIDGVDGE